MQNVPRGTFCKNKLSNFLILCVMNKNYNFNFNLRKIVNGVSLYYISIDHQFDGFSDENAEVERLKNTLSKYSAFKNFESYLRFGNFSVSLADVPFFVAKSFAKVVNQWQKNVAFRRDIAIQNWIDNRYEIMQILSNN